MNNILKQPYTNTEYADFAVQANSNGQRIEQDSRAVYALYTYEILQNGEVVDISDTQEYKDKIAEEQNIKRKTELQVQLNEIEKNQFRSFKAVASGTASELDTKKYNDYETQIESIRADMAAINKML